MDYTRNQAKALCDRSELTLFDEAQPKKLNKLTLVELQDRVSRSRVLRDKWRDVARKQKRSSQARKGHRQTAENARSKDKAQLMAEIHQAFTDRMAAAQAETVQVPMGEKEKIVPRKDRKIVNRAVRSVVRGTLDDVRGEIGKQSTKRKAAKSAQHTKVSTKVAATGSRKTAVSSKTGTAAAAEHSGKQSPKSTKKTAKKKTAKAASKQTSAATKQATSAKATKKKPPQISKARKQALARQEAAAQASSRAALAGLSADALADAKIPTKAQRTAHNRVPRAIATKSRKAVGGSRRLTAHVAATNRRSQARRDAKS